MRRIGIFSGTFDPIHNGHLAFARRALAAGDLEKVFFLIEPRPRRKQGVRALEHRSKMVELAIKDEPKFGRIVLEQARFTVEKTLPALVNRFAGSQLYLLFGEDVLDHLTDWPHVADLFNSVHFIIGARSTSTNELAAQVKTISEARGLPFHYRVINTPDLGVSSQLVRQELRSAGRSQHLHPAVATYIKKHGLYYN